MTKTNLTLAMIMAIVSSPSAQKSGPKPASSGWRLVRTTDKMNDSERLTVVLSSVEGNSSLRVHCNDKGTYVVFLTVPKSVQVGDPTVAEVRFDKGEAKVLAMTKLDAAFLINAVNGSSTELNLAFSSSDAAKALAGKRGPKEVADAATNLIASIKTSARLVYRLTLAAGDSGTEGTFNLAGFTEAAAPLAAKCPMNQP